MRSIFIHMTFCTMRLKSWHVDSTDTIGYKYRLWKLKRLRSLRHDIDAINMSLFGAPTEVSWDRWKSAVMYCSGRLATMNVTYWPIRGTNLAMVVKASRVAAFSRHSSSASKMITDFGKVLREAAR